MTPPETARSHRTKVLLVWTLVFVVLTAATTVFGVHHLLRRSQRTAEAVRDAGGSATVASRLLDGLSIPYEQFFGTNGFGVVGRMPLLPSVVAVDASAATQPSVLETVPSLSQLRYLYLNENTGVDDRFLQRCGRLRHLVDLRLAETEVTGSGLQNISANRGLVRLVLNGTDVGDEAMSILPNFSGLAVLSLTDTAVGDRGIAAFRSGRSSSSAPLKMLWLDDTESTDAAVRHLGGIGLRQLDLSGCSITDEGVQSMQPLEFEKLEALILTDTQITDACLEHLASMPALLRVHAEGTAITREAAAGFGSRGLVIFSSPPPTRGD